MFKGYEDIVKYLIGEHLIGEEAIVTGDLAIFDTSRRNNNFRVASSNCPSYFIKQETRHIATEIKSFGTVEYESKVYGLLGEIFVDRPFFKYLVCYYNFDPRHDILILEGVGSPISIYDYHLSRKYFSSRIAKELGKAVAGLHTITAMEKVKIEKSLGVLEKPPWIFTITEPHHWIYFNSSASNIEFLKIVQKSQELCRLLEDLQHSWKNETLIHCDLKWDNCLIPQTTSWLTFNEIKIVDWELARMGDPCWDVGTIFSEYLNIWLSSIPFSSDAPPDQFVKIARFPLEKMHPAIHAFWNAYKHHSSLGQEMSSEWLLRSIKYAGVRLVQSAFEELQIKNHLNNKIICLLQVCMNMLSRPVEAAVQLLGFPLPKEEYDEVLHI